MSISSSLPNPDLSREGTSSTPLEIMHRRSTAGLHFESFRQDLMNRRNFERGLLHRRGAWR